MKNSKYGDIVYWNDFDVIKKNYILEGNVIECSIHGDIDQSMIYVFLDMISDARNSRDYMYANHILVTFSSIGGLVHATHDLINIVETFNKFNEKKISMIGSSTLQSGGLFVFLSGRNRLCYKNTLFMYHELSSDTDGTLSCMKNDIKGLEMKQITINNYMFSKTKLTEDMFKPNVDYWFNSNDALKYGVVDNILDFERVQD